MIFSPWLSQGSNPWGTQPRKKEVGRSICLWRLTHPYFSCRKWFLEKLKPEGIIPPFFFSLDLFGIKDLGVLREELQLVIMNLTFHPLYGTPIHLSFPVYNLQLILSLYTWLRGALRPGRNGGGLGGESSEFEGQGGSVMVLALGGTGPTNYLSLPQLGVGGVRRLLAAPPGSSSTYLKPTIIE